MENAYTHIPKETDVFNETGGIWNWQTKPINSMGIPFLARNSEIMAAGGVVGILILMVMPLPPFLLDLLLSFNITFALTILLVGTYLLKTVGLFLISIHTPGGHSIQIVP